jgi:transposase
MMSANDRTAVGFTLSEGQLHDAPQGRLLMETVGKLKSIIPLVMDRAYEDELTRFIAQTLNFKPVVPPKSNRKNPWAYDKELYKRRNEIERLFRLLDGFRRVFVRFEKLDKMYMGFVKLALIYVAIK